MYINIYVWKKKKKREIFTAYLTFKKRNRGRNNNKRREKHQPQSSAGFSSFPQRHCLGSDLRGRDLRGPVAFRVATAAVKPTRQHRDVVPNLAVSSQLGVSVFRYRSARCRAITTNHSSEAKASMRRSLREQKQQEIKHR